MENITNNQPLSRVEAVISSMNENMVELQIAGSYETFQWPRNMVQVDFIIGQKIILELKHHPVTNIQKVVAIAKSSQEAKDGVQQIKLLESLIN